MIMFRRALRQRRLFSSQRPGLSTARNSLPRSVTIIASVAAVGYAGFSYGYAKAELSRSSKSQARSVPPEASRTGESDPHPPLSLEEAVSKLRNEEFSCVPGERLGVSHYDVVRVPSNYPVEDDLIHGVLNLAPTGTESPTEKSLLFWGVFDGHVGWQMSTKLRLSLMAYVSHELDLVRQSTADASLSPEVFDAAIKKAFVKLDDDVMNGAEAAAKAENLLLATTASRLAPAYAGSCALLALYDPESRLFRLACTGDSRGVLGRERSNGTWETIPLSDDQTCYNTSEVLRLQQQHPNEPDMIQKGRVLGMAITRGFGDGRWKWDAETQELMKDKFCGESLRPNLHSPPYLTAEPVVSTIEIQPGHDFVILASDGLWDHMTNEQAVDLVGRWVIEQRGKGAEKSRAKAQDEQMQDGKVAKRPRVVFGKDTWKVTEGSITVVDDNAATHLARNALGGANEEMLTGMLTLQAPQSREVRDDLTVQVIFFKEN